MKTKNKIVTINKKQAVDDEEWYGIIFECPNCSGRSIMNRFKFCPDCGFKLRFTKEAKEL